MAETRGPNASSKTQEGRVIMDRKENLAGILPSRVGHAGAGVAPGQRELELKRALKRPAGSMLTFLRTLEKNANELDSGLIMEETNDYSLTHD